MHKEIYNVQYVGVFWVGLEIFAEDMGVAVNNVVYTAWVKVRLINIISTNMLR